MKAVPIAPVSLPLYWPQIEGWVQRALEKAKSDIAVRDVCHLLLTGDMQLWLAWDDGLQGCCITEVHESVRGRSCNLVVVAGDDFGTWAHLESDVAAWARGMGCQRLTLVGRMGWKRRLARIGWKPASITLEKEIAPQTVH